MIAHAPSLVLVCWALLTALGGDGFAAAWLAAMAVAVLAVICALYNRYRHE